MMDVYSVSCRKVYHTPAGFVNFNFRKKLRSSKEIWYNDIWAENRLKYVRKENFCDDMARSIHDFTDFGWAELSFGKHSRNHVDKIADVL